MWTMAYSNRRVAATPAEEIIFWKVTHLNNTALGRGVLTRLQTHLEAQDAAVGRDWSCERGAADQTILQFIT